MSQQRRGANLVTSTFVVVVEFARYPLVDLFHLSKSFCNVSYSFEPVALDDCFQLMVVNNKITSAIFLIVEVELTSYGALL